MKYMAIIDADEKPVSCEFIGCNGNVAPYLIGATTNIKPLEQQPKTGHWEYVQYDYNPDIGNWHCSKCRSICTEMHSIEDAYNYCPNCGCRMKGEEE